MPSADFYLSEYSNVVDLLGTRAHQYADKTAFVLAEGVSWRNGARREDQAIDRSNLRSDITYGQVWQQVIAIAAMLQQQKAFGERVLIIQKPGIGFITAYLGCLCAGAIAVPAYPPRKNHHFERLQSILSSAEARFVLTDQQNIDKFQTQAQNWPALGHAIWIASDSVQPELAAQWQHLNIPSDHLAMLQYTSGSTGQPKGVMIQHQHLLHNAFLIHECFQTHDANAAVNVCWLPPYHDMGLIGGILQPLTVGASTVLMDPVAFLQRPIRWLEAIHQYRGVVSGGPNFAYSLCSDAIKLDDCADFDLSSWEIAFVGAEPIKAQVLEKFAKKFAPLGFRERAFLPCYGMAEATLMVTGRKGLRKKRVDTSALREHRVVKASVSRSEVAKEEKTGQEEKAVKAENLVSCGLPIDKVQVKIVDPHTCKPCKPEEIGEIWVSSDSIAVGYWRSPELTKETFIDRDDNSLRFLRTGDMGFLDEGELYVTGRLKELMIIRGRNFYPQDIEQAVQASYAGLRASNGAAFTISYDSEEALVVVQEVERTALRKLDKDAAIKAIRRAVAEQFELQTAAIILVKPAQLPKTTSGKIQRGRCREKLLDRSLTVVHSWSTLPDLCNEAAPRSSSTLDEAPVPSGVQAVDETQGSRRWQQLIQDWLIESISKHLKIEADQLKLREPLADYGLSSLVAVRLSGELQDWLELPLDPTLLYDYPSIEALSKELAKRKQNTASKNTADKRSSSDDLPEIELPSHPQRRDANDDIAVIGMGCRFPGAATLDDYWKLLLDGEDAVQSVPPSRWDVDAYYDARSGIEGKMTTRYGGFIENVDRFDAQFFKISPREAASMDPQQRLLLEVAWETLEQAGIAPSTLKGSQTGVFVGMSSNDYSRLKLKQQLPPTAYFGTSHALSIVSNRLSYVMDWRGPSVTVDTACSSSLVAIHQACQSLKMKDCDLAIAGGVNIILDPDLTVVFSQAQMMAADGRCKTFDATADGYVRAEGCGMVLLKPLSAARRDGDTIFGVIKGSAVNQDGRSNGLTAPNAQSQQAVITQALKAARIYPDRVSYIEAHGTGTALGDPIEVNALKAVFEPRRSLQNPLYIGSVKTNIGHLESAAGIAGFIKVILSLHHRTIVPTLHCKQINPLIDIANTPIEIAQSKQLWQKQSTPRYHGISSFGFGGTNAHLVVSEAPAVSPSSLPTLSAQKLPSQKSSSQKSLKRDADRLPAQPLTDTLEKTASFEKPLKKKKRPYHLITLSAATPEALQAQVEQYRKFVLEHPEVTLGDLCFSVNTTRERLAWRISLIVQSRDDLLEQLASQNIQQRYKPAAAAANRCAFLFAKQGNPWQVGYQLYATQPQFRAQLDRCDEILQPIWQRSLVSLLYTDVDGQSLLQDAYYGRPALLAVQYAIASLWMSWGVVPSAVAGDSFSELIAACAAGATDLQAVLQQAAQKERPPQAISTPDQQNARLDQKTQAGAAYDLTQLEATGCDVCIEITPSSLRPPFVQKKLLFVPAINKASEDWKTLFRGLVALDRLGTPLSWHKIDGPYGNRLSNLPTYPFQRRRYWFDNSNHTSSVTASTASQESTSSDVVTPGTATAVDSSQIHLAPQLSTFSNGSSLSPSAPETTSPDAAPPTTHLTAQLEVDSSAATSAEAMNDIEQVISSQLSVLETLMTQQLAVLEGGAGDISLPTSPLVENGPFEDKPLKNKPTIDEPLVHELK